MQVKLVSVTKPEVEGLTTAEDLIVYCARVSNPKNQLNTETGPKLLKYCLDHKHFSIFEMAHMTVEIETSRAIAAQILRHKSFNFQEFCISGDSKITVIRPNGTVGYITIKKLFERQNWKNYKNIKLRVYDETKKEFTSASFKEVFKTGIKPVYEVEFEDGKKIKCTKEHKFLTENGFLPLEEALGLRFHGNTVCMENPKLLAVNGNICYQNYDWLKNKKIECINNGTGLPGIAAAANVSTHTIRKWLRKFNLQFSKKEVSLYTPVWNKGKTGYKLPPKTLEQREYMKKITPRGKDHHAYKGGTASERKAIANYFNSYRKDIFKKFNYTCQMCKRPFSTFDGKIDLHHIKEVSLYPELALDINNVIPVHKKCHMEYHGKSYFFKQIRRGHKGNTLVPRFKKVISVKFLGEEETYDIEICHSSHNYVANGVIVHNSQRYSEVTEFELYEPRRQDLKNKQNSIDDLPAKDKDWFMNALIGVNTASKALYDEAIRRNIAKESARFLLPLTAKTTLYMSGSVRSWLHYIEVRTDPSTQLEHREIAEEIKKVFIKQFPNVANAKGWLDEN